MRLAEFLPIFFGKMILLAIVRTWQKKSLSCTPPSTRGGIPSSQAREAKTVTIEGQVISPGVDEKGEEGVIVVTQRAPKEIFVRLGTRSLERREL